MKLTEKDLLKIENLTDKEKKIQLRANNALEKSKISIPKIAEHFGITKVPVYRWFQIKIPSDRISELAKLLGVSFLWLSCEDNAVTEPVAAYGIKPIHDESDLDEDDIMINLYDVELSAGNGSEIPEFIETKKQLSFSLDWIQRKGFIPRDLKLMKVRGDSMNTVLNDGDMVLINTSRTDIIDGKIYAIGVGGEAKIKRLKRSFDGGLVIMSDNPSDIYKDEILSPNDMKYVKVFGLAVHRQGDI